MRRTFVLLATGLCSGCTSTVLAEPSILVSPYLAVYQLRGKTRMQSPGANPGDPPQDNDLQRMQTFGQDRHREDVGVRADLGDGFGGIRLDYYRLDMGTTRTGTLWDDWGALPAGEQAQIRAQMDEIRLGWVEPVLDVRTEWRDRPLRLRFGAGGVYAYRSMDLMGRTGDGMIVQNASIRGDVAYGAVRARAEWRDFALDLEYAVSPGAVLSGDYEGWLQDLEARASYRLPQRDIRFFAGMRYSTLPAEGRAGDLRYDADLILDGFQFGFSVTF